MRPAASWVHRCSFTYPAIFRGPHARCAPARGRWFLDTATKSRGQLYPFHRLQHLRDKQPPRPIVATPAEEAHQRLSYDLQAVAVQFQFMQLAGAERHRLAGRGDAGVDEPNASALGFLGIRHQHGYVEICVEGDLLFRDSRCAMRLSPLFPTFSPTGISGLTRGRPQSAVGVRP
jgi:hypothetical protein